MTAENSMPLGDLIWAMEDSMLLSDQAFKEGNDPISHIVEEPDVMLFGEIVYDL